MLLLMAGRMATLARSVVALATRLVEAAIVDPAEKAARSVKSLMAIRAAALVTRLAQVKAVEGCMKKVT